jgi:hypothetical protein
LNDAGVRHSAAVNSKPFGTIKIDVIRLRSNFFGTIPVFPSPLAELAGVFIIFFLLIF